MVKIKNLFFTLSVNFTVVMVKHLQLFKCWFPTGRGQIIIIVLSVSLSLVMV